MHFLIALLLAESVATVAGTTVKETHCERCSLWYVYRMKRKATAKTTSFIVANQAAAKEEANKKLSRVLAKECDNVPCPACGWYQRPMVRKLKREHLRWLSRNGLICLTAAPVLAAVSFLCSANERNPDFLDPTSTPARIFLRLAGFALVIGVCLPIAKVIMAWMHDPNLQDEDLRRELGQSLACGKDDYLSGEALLP